MSRTPTLLQVGMLLTVMSLIGCSTPGDRVVAISEDARQRQAEQNRQMARLIESQRSVEAGFQAERMRLDEERSELERDRRREPIVAAAIWSAALLLAVVLPVVLAIYLVRALGSNPPSEDLSELLVGEFTTQQPMLLPPTPDLPRLDRGKIEPADEAPRA